jgi:hypothetical protein
LPLNRDGSVGHFQQADTGWQTNRELLSRALAIGSGSQHEHRIGFGRLHRAGNGAEGRSQCPRSCFIIPQYWIDEQHELRGWSTAIRRLSHQGFTSTACT